MQVNLNKLLNLVGESEIKQLLSDFSCPFNINVEDCKSKKLIIKAWMDIPPDVANIKIINEKSIDKREIHFCNHFDMGILEFIGITTGKEER